MTIDYCDVILHSTYRSRVYFNTSCSSQNRPSSQSRLSSAVTTRLSLADTQCPRLLSRTKDSIITVDINGRQLKPQRQITTICTHALYGVGLQHVLRHHSVDRHSRSVSTRCSCNVGLSPIAKRQRGFK